MKKITINVWKYISIVMMGILAFGIAAPQHFAQAANTVLIIVQDIQTKVTSIKSTVDTNLDDKITSRATQTSVNNLQTTADGIKAKTDNLPSDPADNSEILGAISSISLSGGGYVPFKVAVTGLPATCDAAGGAASSNHSITIDGASDFMVTSVLFAPLGVDEADDFIFASLLVVDLTNYSFAIPAIDITGSIPFDSAFEVMGLPTSTGAKWPTAVAAVGAGGDDITIFISCGASTTTDITFAAGSIIVSGWKLPSDTITVAYS